MSTEKGVKLDDGKPRLDLVLGDFADALWRVGTVGTYGANKYTDKGWQEVDNGIERYGNAMLRHYFNYRKGIVYDDESNLLHLAHMAWNALAMLQLYLMPHMTPECNIPIFKDTTDYIPGSIVEVQVDHEDFRPIIAHEGWEKLIRDSFKGEVKPEEETVPIYKPIKDICRCELKME